MVWTGGGTINVSVILDKMQFILMLTVSQFNGIYIFFIQSSLVEVRILQFIIILCRKNTDG